MTEGSFSECLVEGRSREIFYLVLGGLGLKMLEELFSSKVGSISRDFGDFAEIEVGDDIAHFKSTETKTMIDFIFYEFFTNYQKISSKYVSIFDFLK